jgi:hypothetical protein
MRDLAVSLTINAWDSGVWTSLVIHSVINKRAGLAVLSMGLFMFDAVLAVYELLQFH